MPKCELGEKLALETHIRYHHGSQKATFNALRQRYWFCGGFRYVKNAVRRLCKTPRCRYIKYCSPRMSPLPNLRIDNPEPWRNVGVDYLGPLIVRHECYDKVPENCTTLKNLKVWLAVFTCFHTRAVHVEVVESCTTNDFLTAFRRFIATCGKQRHLRQLTSSSEPC